MKRHHLITILAAFLLPLGAFGQGPAVPPDAAKLKADPAADLFMAAQIAYQEAVDAKDPKMKQANFAAAVQQFSRFLQFHHDHPNAVRAWFYSASCYQKLGQQDAAWRCLNAVVEDGRKGPLVGDAAYNLANHYYDDKEPARAEPFYAIAAREHKDAAARQFALFRRALCFQKLDKLDETMVVLEAVASDPASPYKERAEVVLAYHYKDTNRLKEALALFEKLATSPDAKTKADATLQAALVSRDLDDTSGAEAWFEKILTTPGLDQWRGEAQLALMSSASINKNHQRVIALYNRGKFKLTRDQQASRVRLAIQALEALGRRDDTTALYRELEGLDPGGKTAFEAAFILLARSYGEGEKGFVRASREFLKRYGGDHPDAPETHNARLMLAESLFQAKDYRAASAEYQNLDFKHIKPENHLGVRYRLATACLEAGDLPGAIIATNDFLANHADDKRVSNILAKRADAFLANGETDKALADFEKLLLSAPDPVLREYAWAAKAGIHKDRQDYDQLIECHRHLLAEFPDRLAAHQAGSHFWIGWAHFHQGQFAEGIPHFRKARQGDTGTLGLDATRHLALSHYSLQQQEELTAELDLIISDYPRTKVPRNVFAWLGVKLALDKNYEKAWRYLTRAVTPKNPDDTKTVVWRSHAQAALETGNFREAIPSFEIVLERDQNAFLKAESLYHLARCHYGLNDLDKARTCAEEALAFKPQGKLNGQIRLVLGDVSLAENDAKTAAQDYVVVVELFANDPEVLKDALRRAAAALGDLGDPQSLKDAQRYRERLKAIQAREAAENAP